jgi:hypothetical protein
MAGKGSALATTSTASCVRDGKHWLSTHEASSTAGTGSAAVSAYWRPMKVTPRS